MKKKILIITTGGTLASAKSEEGLVPELSSKDVFSHINSIVHNYELQFLDLFSIDSANMQPEEWQTLARTIFNESTNYQGIVIIHGTDTMAYTASILTFMLPGLPIPVVLTGSQLSILNPIADAIENCRCAMSMAGSNVPGIFVAFNRKIIRGCRASKVRTISFDAFESINSPYVGMVNSNGLDLAMHILSPPTEPFTLQENLSSKVFLLKLIPGMDPIIFDMLADKGYEGIYIEAFGIGSLPFIRRDLSTAIETTIKRGITILTGTQCLYDGSNLTVYQAGQKILQKGALQSHDMTTEAAITKLMWVLGQTKVPAEITSYFERNLCGEVNLPKPISV